MESWTESLQLTTVRDTIKDDTGDYTTAEIQEYIDDCFEDGGRISVHHDGSASQDHVYTETVGVHPAQHTSVAA
eukprot:1385389-Prymnesium_polylepis.1